MAHVHRAWLLGGRPLTRRSSRTRRRDCTIVGRACRFAWFCALWASSGVAADSGQLAAQDNGVKARLVLSPGKTTLQVGVPVGARIEFVNMGDSPITLALSGGRLRTRLVYREHAPRGMGGRGHEGPRLQDLVVLQPGARHPVPIVLNPRLSGKAELQIVLANGSKRVTVLDEKAVGTSGVRRQEKRVERSDLWTGFLELRMPVEIELLPGFASFSRDMQLRFYRVGKYSMLERLSLLSEWAENLRNERVVVVLQERLAASRLRAERVACIQHLVVAASRAYGRRALDQLVRLAADEKVDPIERLLALDAVSVARKGSLEVKTEQASYYLTIREETVELAKVALQRCAAATDPVLSARGKELLAQE